MRTYKRLPVIRIRIQAAADNLKRYSYNSLCDKLLAFAAALAAYAATHMPNAMLRREISHRAAGEVYLD